MCAILGIFSNTVVPPSFKLRFKKTLSLTSHRGPDQSNEVFLNNALLGFNRLSIVGVNNGLQPLANEDSTIFVLCNGEIYNYPQLRAKLEGKHSFSTDSDCEVIVHLYEDDPDGFVSQLKGQFAFIIYDMKKKRVILARDRFGINPLFYAEKSGVLFVSSEAKSILSLDSTVSSELDPIALKEMLFLYGPTPPRTAFQGISQVIPGHILTFNVNESKVIENRRYWNLPEKVARPESQITKEFLRLFSAAVERRTQGADQSVAVYLSGGMDSSAVAAILKKTGSPVVTFSVRFQDPAFDESKYQDLVSTFLKAPNFSVTGDILCDSNIFQTVWHTEHPLLRTAPLPLYSLSHLVHSKGKKFVCCGEGADEMLLGYPVFLKGASSIQDKLHDYSSIDDLFVYCQQTGQQMVDSLKEKTSKKWSIPIDSIRLPQMLEVETKLSRYLLVQQGDRQSMSHGIEQRFPFLDEDLVDYLFSLPDEQLNKCVLGKKVLKENLRTLLPAAVIDRKKQGYLSPMAQQLYDSSVIQNLAATSETVEFIKIIKRYYNLKKVQQLVNKFQNKKLSDVETIGLLLVLSTVVLHEQFFGGPS